LNASTLFNNTTGTALTTQLWRQLANDRNFIMLRDSGPCFVSADSDPAVLWHKKWYIPLNLVTVYNDTLGVDTDISSNALWIVSWCTATVNFPQISLSGRVRFIDC